MAEALVWTPEGPQLATWLVYLYHISYLLWLPGAFRDNKVALPDTQDPQSEYAFSDIALPWWPRVESSGIFSSQQAYP